VTANIASEAREVKSTKPSTAGITTKVIRGSLWTLVGQALPLAVTLVATPFNIWLLGSEAYGVVILVGLIPTYFSFADFGMGVASTRFGSEAYGEGDPRKEGELVRGAAFIALISSLFIAIPLFVFSSWIIDQFAVPENLRSSASVALKVASVSFILTILATVLNTPLLARLRMDVNTLTTALPKVAAAALTPFVLYLGGGILGPICMVFIAGLVGCVLLIYFSAKLLPGFLTPSIDRIYFPRLIKFGAGWMLGSIAGIFLINLEKLALSHMVSVRSLAYYSIAFTFAGMASFFSSAMLQSLSPAFAQLLGPDKKQEFDALFTRGIRFNLILLLPAIAVLFVIAKPFFTLWAGPEFGAESTVPFYILLFGLLFNILAYVPHSAITAHGRTDIFAKLYWLELILYAVAVYFLIKWFGIAGAAAAWTMRVILDAVAIFFLSRKIANVPFPIRKGAFGLAAAAILLVPPALFAALYDSSSPWLFVLTPAALCLYALVIWTSFIEPVEKQWIRARALGLLRA
jgi:O-antigen/teichoic acid export membrane protein